MILDNHIKTIMTKIIIMIRPRKWIITLASCNTDLEMLLCLVQRQNAFQICCQAMNDPDLSESEQRAERQPSGFMHRIRSNWQTRQNISVLQLWILKSRLQTFMLLFFNRARFFVLFDLFWIIHFCYFCFWIHLHFLFMFYFYISIFPWNPVCVCLFMLLPLFCFAFVSSCLSLSCF